MYVDGMHKANYASKLSHSCSPNCEVRVRVVDGRYVIHMHAIKNIQPGEELAYNYHCTTDNEAEFKNTPCLCGTRHCLGNFFHLSNEQTYQHVMGERHRLVDRQLLLLRACERWVRVFTRQAQTSRPQTTIFTNLNHLLAHPSLDVSYAGSWMFSTGLWRENRCRRRRCSAS